MLTRVITVEDPLRQVQAAARIVEGALAGLVLLTGGRREVLPGLLAAGSPVVVLAEWVMGDG